MSEKFDAWTGAEYGLALVLSPGDESFLQNALAALWQSDDLRGCSLSREASPEQERVQPTVDTVRHYGVVTIGGLSLPCYSLLIRTAREVWLYLAIPMGAIHAAYDAAVADDEALPPWERELVSWFVAHARRVAAAARFAVGFVGWFGDSREDDELERFERSGHVPSQRVLGFVVPSEPVFWFPPTRGADARVRMPKD